MYNVGNAKFSEIIIHLSYGYCISTNPPQNLTVFCLVCRTKIFYKDHIFLKRSSGLIHILHFETSSSLFYLWCLNFLSQPVDITLNTDLVFWCVWSSLQDLISTIWQISLFLFTQVTVLIFQEILTVLKTSNVPESPPGILLLDGYTLEIVIHNRRHPPIYLNMWIALIKILLTRDLSSDGGISEIECPLSCILDFCCRLDVLCVILII